MALIFRPGATALISGGASGVGYAMAQICRRNGMHIALLDNNGEHLEQASAALKSTQSDEVKTETYRLDVGDLKAWQDIKSTVTSTFGGVDFLMLNAGTSVKPTTSQSYEDVEYFHKTLNTNMFGVVNGLATFLPLVQQSAKSLKTKGGNEKCGIVITGSKQGITNPPGAGNPAYNMSKSALKTLAEHLAHDLRTEGNPSYAPNVSVHLLIPGWTFTGLSGNPGPLSSSSSAGISAGTSSADSSNSKSAPAKPNGAWFAQQVADYAFPRIDRGQFYIICPDDDVDEALDRARMEWAMADVAEGEAGAGNSDTPRPALSRWDARWKDDAAKWIDDRAKALRKG